MQLTSNSFVDGAVVPAANAFGVPHAETHVALSDNKNPHLAWTDAPAATKSFVVICVDPDVPSKADDVNQEGREVPSDLPRVDFYHWVLVDVPADKTAIAEGEFAHGVTPGGKPGPDAAGGTRQGINNYTQWFAGDADMGGDWFGYDGPCPPWNDSIIHHYHFRVFALDVARLDVSGTFDGPAAVAAMEGHVLAQASLMGTYTLNPRLR